MQLEAIPMQFVALTDGVLNGEEHILLFLDHVGFDRTKGVALTLPDARMLLEGLRHILPEAQKIQNRIREQN